MATVNDPPKEIDSILPVQTYYRFSGEIVTGPTGKFFRGWNFSKYMLSSFS